MYWGNNKLKTIIISSNLNPGQISKMDKAILQKDACTCMIIAALFTIAKIEKQPKCPSTHEWIQRIYFI